MVDSAARFFPWGFTLLAALGCSASGLGSPDADQDWTDVQQPSGTLHFEAGIDTKLSHREVAVIDGQYLDPDGNPASTTVTLSLLGNAYDTTIDSTIVESRASDEGRFTAKIIAGSVDTEFTLRAVAEDGARCEIDIKVISSSRGKIIIEPVYEGRRAIDYYIVRLYGDETSCDSMDAAPRFESPPATAPPVTFSHLPEDASFTVHVLGYACDDEVLAGECFRWTERCETGIRSHVESSTPVTLRVYDDIDYFSHEAFSTSSMIDASTALEGRSEAMLAPLGFLSGTVEDVAEYILDSIQGTFDSPDADIFSSARQAGGLDRAVADILGAGDWSPSTELEGLRELLSEAPFEFVFAGRLERNFWPEHPEEEFYAKHVMELVGLEGGNVIDEVLPAEARESQTLVSYQSDIAHLGAHTVPVGAGGLLLGIARSIYLPGIGIDAGPDAEPFLDWLEHRIDCGAVADALAGNEDLSLLADAEEYESRCTGVLDEVVRGVEIAAEEADLHLPGITLEGNADFLEEDGTPRPGKTAAGSWTELSWGSEILPTPQSFALEPSDPME